MAKDLNKDGFVTDFAHLSVFSTYLDSAFDHRLLNDVVDFPPTCERLAEYLGGWFIENVEPRLGVTLVSMQVAETATSSATWHRGGDW